jgi:N-methylhydantoinase B
VSSIADRTAYPAPGLLGGRAGATGEVTLSDGTRLNAKALKDLKPGEVVRVNLPGGGGYGDPMRRDSEKVRWDVIEGYITPEEAEKNYSVAVRYDGKPDELVKLPESWIIDQEKTARMRERMKNQGGRVKIEDRG